MSKHCPILNRKVIYLDCLECDDRSRCSETSEHITSSPEPIVTTTTIGFLKCHLIRCKCGSTPTLKTLLCNHYEVVCPSCGKSSCPVHYATGAAIMWNRSLFDYFTNEDVNEAASILNIKETDKDQNVAQLVKDILTKGKEVK